MLSVGHKQPEPFVVCCNAFTQFTVHSAEYKIQRRARKASGVSESTFLSGEEPFPRTSPESGLAKRPAKSPAQLVTPSMSWRIRQAGRLRRLRAATETRATRAIEMARAKRDGVLYGVARSYATDEGFGEWDALGSSSSANASNNTIIERYFSRAANFRPTPACCLARQ